MEDMATLVLDMVDMDIPVLDILVFMVAIAVASMAMASVRLRLSPRLLLTPTFWEDMEDMATLGLDIPVLDMLVLDILVFMVAMAVASMAMASVRLSPRLLLTPTFWEDMVLDMEDMDMVVVYMVDMDILDSVIMVVIVVMDLVAKNYYKTRTLIHTDCHVPFSIVQKLSE